MVIAVTLPLTINDFLDRAVAVYPERVAIIDEPEQPAPALPDLTYRDLGEIRRSIGVALDELGVPMGGRVAVVSQNSARFLTMYYGIPGNRRVIVPINFRLKPDEVAYIVEHSGAEVLLIDPEIADSL
jgi:fatty-acyl-CoA synthase